MRFERLWRYDIARYGGTARQSRGRRRQMDPWRRAVRRASRNLMELGGRHVLRLKDDMGRVVAAPVPVQNPPLGLERPEERRTGVRREDVEGRALEPVRLDPLGRRDEHVPAVLVEAEDEAAVHLDPVVVENRDPAGEQQLGEGRIVPPRNEPPAGPPGEESRDDRQDDQARV